MINVEPRCGHKMSTRHRSFKSFIDERLKELGDDLEKECERIAVQRELHLKTRIEKLQYKVKHPDFAGKNKITADNSDGAEMPNEGHVELANAVFPDVRLLSGCASGETAANEMIFDQDDTEQSMGKEQTITSIDGPLPRDLNANGYGAGNDVMTSEPNVAIFPSEKQDASDAVEAQQSVTSVHEDSFQLWSEWAQPAHFTESPVIIVDSIAVSSFDIDTSGTQAYEWFRGHDFLAVHSNTRSCGTVAPSGHFGMAWDFVGLPVLLYDLVTLPLQVFWSHQDAIADIIQMIILFYWTIDVGLRLFVLGHVTQSGRVQLNRRAIMVHYITHTFLFDIALLIPDWMEFFFDVPRKIALLRIVRLFRFLRVLRVKKLRDTMRKLQDLIDSELTGIYVNVFINVVMILGCCHYLACAWYWTGKRPTHGYDNWIARYSDHEDDWVMQYMTSLHWALCQFTPGSMKVQPVNPLERGLAIFVIVWGMVFFSLFLSSITQERMRLRSLTKKIDRDNWMMRRYMRQHGVSREFSVRAVQYVDAFVAPMMQRVQRKDVALLDCLSHPLQVELQAEIYFHTLLVHPFFVNLKAKSITMASSLFSDVSQEVSLAKYDLLFEVGQVSHEMFFMSQGAVGYIKNATDDVVVFHPGDWCCEQVIWVPWVHKGTSRAAGESHLLSVDSAKFRTGVLEYRERTYVRNCAKAYLADLKKCVLDGIVIDDTLCMDQYELSFVGASGVSSKEMSKQSGRDSFLQRTLDRF